MLKNVMTMVIVLGIAASASAVVAPGGIFPEARWEFEGPAGIGEDSTGNGWTLTPASDAGVVNLLPGLHGQYGVLETNTADTDTLIDGLDVPAMGSVEEFTVMMWIKPTIADDLVGPKGGLQSDNWANGNVNLRLNGGYMDLGMRSSFDGLSGGTQLNGNILRGTTQLPLGEWSHIAASYKNGGYTAIYLNGVLEGWTVGTKTANFDDSTLAAHNNVGGGILGRGLTGGHDDARVYFTALDADQILLAATGVPEPMTLALLGLGGLGLVRRRRK